MCRTNEKKLNFIAWYRDCNSLIQIFSIRSPVDSLNCYFFYLLSDWLLFSRWTGTQADWTEPFKVSNSDKSTHHLNANSRRPQIHFMSVIMWWIPAKFFFSFSCWWHFFWSESKWKYTVGDNRNRVKRHVYCTLYSKSTTAW